MRVTVVGTYKEQVLFGHELAKLTETSEVIKSIKCKYTPDADGEQPIGQTDFEVEILS